MYTCALDPCEFTPANCDRQQANTAGRIARRAMADRTPHAAAAVCSIAGARQTKRHEHSATKCYTTRNVAMERARRATAMKMTKAMSNDDDQTWWTAAEARLLAPWSTKNCAVKRNPRDRAQRNLASLNGVGREARDDDEMMSTMSNDDYQTRRTAAEGRLLAPWSTQSCLSQRFNFCVVAISARSNLARR